MTPKALQNLCKKLPGATENIQWGDDRVFKVGGKMFACSGLDQDSKISFKVDDERFLELTDIEGIAPAPYLARAKWVQIDPACCALPKSELQGLVRRSYDLVFAKLTKKARKEIADANDVV